MEAFSKRQRRKIIRLYQQGQDTEDIAAEMAASISGVRRVWQQYREQGRDEPAYANCGRKPTLDEQQKQQVLALIAERPDAFLHELAEEVGRRLEVRVCRQTLGRWLRGWGLTRKKSPWRPRSSSVRT
jgi:transposase